MHGALCLFPISATSYLSLISISVILLMTVGYCNSVWTPMLFANSHWDFASWMSISSGFFEFPLASGLSLDAGGMVSPDKGASHCVHWSPLCWACFQQLPFFLTNTFHSLTTLVFWQDLLFCLLKFLDWWERRERDREETERDEGEWTTMSRGRGRQQG